MVGATEIGPLGIALFVMQSLPFTMSFAENPLSGLVGCLENFVTTHW